MFTQECTQFIKEKTNISGQIVRTLAILLTTWLRHVLNCESNLKPHCDFHRPIQEYKACNLEACPEVKRNTPWTPWMPVNVTQGGARQEQRMRYMCRAHLSDPHELQIGRRKVETRFCPNDGTAVCETDSELNVFREINPC